MNSKQNEDQSEIICDCAGTTKAKIEQLIHAGKNTLDAVAATTGATTGCGACNLLVEEIIAKDFSTKD